MALDVGLLDHIPALVQLGSFIAVVVGTYWLTQLKIGKLDSHIEKLVDRLEILERVKSEAHEDLSVRIEKLERTKVEISTCVVAHGGLASAMNNLQAEITQLRDVLLNWRKTNGLDLGRKRKED